MKEFESHNVRVVTTNEIKADAIFHNGEVFSYHASGLTRRVFANADRTKVLKVPVTLMDYEHNRKEAEAWSKMNEEERKEFAECKLNENGWLEMEFLTTLHELEEKPDVAKQFENVRMSTEEIKFAQSCRNEVGFDKNGKLKCFDYDEYRRY